MSAAGSQPGLPENIEELYELLGKLEEEILLERDPIRKVRLERDRASTEALIEKRLAREETDSVRRSAIDATRPQMVFSGDVDRAELFENLLEFARARDIVFAIGGVGSGLRTFHEQFLEYLRSKPAAASFEGVDFDRDKFQSILKVRQEINEVFRANEATYLGADQLELKCLLTSLAHSAYRALRDRGFEKQLDSILPKMHVDPNRFVTYYFDNSQCMAEAAAGPIVDYFFATLQRFAEVTDTESILVFMPLPELAKCFQSDDTTARKLAKHLWDALGDLATSRGSSQSSAKREPAPVSKYNKVCLIIASRYVPYGNNASIPSLVAWWVWPIPSFTKAETRKLLGSISHAFETEEAAEKLTKFTGGCPWLTRYALSYVKYLYQPEKETDPTEILERACGLAGEHLPVHRPGNPVSDFAHSYIARIRSTLERGVATDRSLVDAWAGHKRRSGIVINARVESFVASGLVWLKGDVWNNATQDFVFNRFPTVYFREPSTLARIAYEVATECKLPVATW